MAFLYRRGQSTHDVLLAALLMMFDRKRIDAAENMVEVAEGFCPDEIPSGCEKLAKANKFIRRTVEDNCWFKCRC